MYKKVRFFLSSSSILAMTRRALSPSAVSPPLALNPSRGVGDAVLPRPSDLWLNSRNLGWVGTCIAIMLFSEPVTHFLPDGCHNPPLFFTPELMIATLRQYVPTHPALPELEERLANGSFYESRVFPPSLPPAYALQTELQRPYYRESMSSSSLAEAASASSTYFLRGIF
jgi:hypothetical protein